MSIEHVNPDPFSGDPGDEHHRVPAPQPTGPEGLVKQLSQGQVTALQALAAGQSLKQAAKSSGVGRSTIHHWLKNDPHFRAAYNAWKQEMLESARARLLKSADAAVNAVLQSVAKGDSRAALAILKGIGALAPEQPGLTDPAMVAREMELDRRQDRAALAHRSHAIARDEWNFLCDLTTRTEREARQRELERRRSQGANEEQEEPQDDPSEEDAPEDDAYAEEDSQEEDEQDDEAPQDAAPDDDGPEDDQPDDDTPEENAAEDDQEQNEDDTDEEYDDEDDDESEDDQPA